jgi:hypothetical protein
MVNRRSFWGLSVVSGGSDHRHGFWCPAFDGAWVARRCASGGGQCGGGRSHQNGTPAKILKLRRR